MPRGARGKRQCTQNRDQMPGLKGKTRHHRHDGAQARKTRPVNTPCAYLLYVLYAKNVRFAGHQNPAHRRLYFPRSNLYPERYLQPRFDFQEEFYMTSFIRAAALGATLALAGQATHAAVLYQLDEVGADVVGTVSGSLDLTGLSYIITTAFITSYVDPTVGDSVITGPAADLYSGVTVAFATYGTGGLTTTTIESGDVFRIGKSNLAVPANYTSGAALASSVTFQNSSFASLGMTVGSYVYTLPNDTVTLRIGSPAIIPLPATLPALLGALGVGLILGRRRSRPNG